MKGQRGAVALEALLLVVLLGLIGSALSNPLSRSDPDTAEVSGNTASTAEAIMSDPVLMVFGPLILLVWLVLLARLDWFPSWLAAFGPAALLAGLGVVALALIVDLTPGVIWLVNLAFYAGALSLLTAKVLDVDARVPYLGFLWSYGLLGLYFILARPWHGFPQTGPPFGLDISTVLFIGVVHAPVMNAALLNPWFYHLSGIFYSDFWSDSLQLAPYLVIASAVAWLPIWDPLRSFLMSSGLAVIPPFVFALGAVIALRDTVSSPARWIVGSPGAGGPGEDEEDQRRAPPSPNLGGERSDPSSASVTVPGWAEDAVARADLSPEHGKDLALSGFASLEGIADATAPEVCEKTANFSAVQASVLIRSAQELLQVKRAETIVDEQSQSGTLPFVGTPQQIFGSEACEEAREALKEITEAYPSAKWMDPLRCEGLLKDKCPHHRKLAEILVQVIVLGVTEEIQKNADDVTGHRDVWVDRIVRDTGLSEGHGAWAVDCWIDALTS